VLGLAGLPHCGNHSLVTDQIDDAHPALTRMPVLLTASHPRIDHKPGQQV
jgi:hypothetical protein